MIGDSFFSIHRKYIIAAFGFAFGMVILEAFVFPRYYEGFFLLTNLKNGNYLIVLKTIVLGTANFLLAVFFIFASLISPYRYRMLYFILFCIAVLPEYSFQKVFNRFTALEDIGNALFAADMRIITSSIGEYFVTSAIFPCLLFALLLLIIQPLAKKGLKIFLTIVLLYSGFFLFTAYFSTNAFPSTSLNSFYRTLFNFPVSWHLGSIHQPPFSVFYQTPRDEVKFRAQILPNNNIVLIVDESIRGDHLSLNGYDRPTTPFLDELSRKGFIKNWGIAVSGTTCSVTSNNLLLTGVNEIPDETGKIFTSSTVFQYAKASGYKTHYFDGQISYRWIGKPSDMKDVDEWVYADSLKRGDWYDIDAEIARRVNEIVAGSTGNFIWINKFGVHFPYKNSYPATAARWLPTTQSGGKDATENDVSDFEKLKNTYDNGIFYNSQIFFTNLFENGLAADTFYIYTSDHGQNLGENGGANTHCLTTKDEANVPLFIIAEPPSLPGADTAFKASHANIFPTILDLMKIPEADRTANYALSLTGAKSADSKPRYYYSGNLHSKISAGKYLFDR